MPVCFVDFCIFCHIPFGDFLLHGYFENLLLLAATLFGAFLLTAWLFWKLIFVSSNPGLLNVTVIWASSDHDQSVDFLFMSALIWSADKIRYGYMLFMHIPEFGSNLVAINTVIFKETKCNCTNWPGQDMLTSHKGH